MGQVINFPTPESRDWKDMAAAMMEPMRLAGLSDKAQKQVLERMEAFHSKLYRTDFDFTFPPGTPPIIEKQIERFAEKLHNFSAELFLDRLLVEVALATAQKL